MTVTNSVIGMDVTLHTDFMTAKQKVVDALKAEGFGVITEIDVQATVKEKLNEEFRPYVILGACNPMIAHQALTMMPDVGLLLPCNVTLSQTAENTIEVSVVDAERLLSLLDKPELAPYAAQVRGMMLRVAEAL